MILQDTITKYLKEMEDKKIINNDEIKCIL